MALEDYKISNDTVMCWDSDGRLNTNIWPDNLKNNTVATILSRIEEFALIKGLVLDGDYFKQYCKVNGSLYLMCDEVKKLRTAAKRQKVASPILNQLKKYMKEQGFVWDPSDGVYPAPTDKIPENGRTYLGLSDTNGWRDTTESCWVEIYPTDKAFHLKFRQETYTLENDGSKFRVDVTMPAWKETDITYNGFTEENLEKFKKDWTDYKEHLKARLEAFKEEVEERSSLLNTSLKNITDKLKALHYTYDSRNYDYSGGYETWHKNKKLENGLTLRGTIGFSKTLNKEGDYKLRYQPSFELYQGSDEIWDGGNYWSYRANQDRLPRELTPALLQSILGTSDRMNRVSVDSVEEANKIIEKGFADYDDAFSEDEIGFDGHESLSLTEAFKRLRNSEE